MLFTILICAIVLLYINIYFKGKVTNYCRPLFEEQQGKLSLGRVAFLVAFVVAMRNLWVFGDLSYSVVSLLGTLLAYGGYKKYVKSKYYNEELDLEKDESHEA